MPEEEAACRLPEARREQAAQLVHTAGCILDGVPVFREARIPNGVAEGAELVADRLGAVLVAKRNRLEHIADAVRVEHRRAIPLPRHVQLIQRPRAGLARDDAGPEVGARFRRDVPGSGERTCSRSDDAVVRIGAAGQDQQCTSDGGEATHGILLEGVVCGGLP
jgi:hypothetical protein